MHELSVATDIAQSAFGAAEGRRLERLTLQNGAFSSVSSESLRFYLEILTEEHEGRPVDIVIQESKARCVCECGEAYETDRFLNPCPKCGGWKRKVESGMECRLESIEVATDDIPTPPTSEEKS